MVLVGGAFSSDVVARIPTISAAAAKWQLGFAAAIAEHWACTARCLSYVLLPSDLETPPQVADGRVVLYPVVRPRSLGGSVRYAIAMLKLLVRIGRGVRCVFAYNPLVWTVPFAWVLALTRGAPLIIIVADLEPSAGTGIRRVLRRASERLFLLLGRRFLLLSNDSRRVIWWPARVGVFNGLADERALAAPQATYTGARLRFVYAGTISDDAGVSDLLAAASAVVSNGRDCEFHFFGRGSESLPVPDNLAGRVVLHGFVEESELLRFMGTDCVGVNPRRRVGGVNAYNAPFKILYYLSRGIVTVTTRTEGVPEDLLEPCVIALEGPEGLAAAIDRVAAMSPDELAAGAEEGRALVRRTRTAGRLASIAGSLVASRCDAVSET